MLPLLNKTWYWLRKQSQQQFDTKKKGQRVSHGPNTVRLHCELLEDRVLMSADGVAPEEQLFVYLLNLARHDPVTYQEQQNLPISLAGVAAQPPLAVNNDLFVSTDFHASDMATRHYFAHDTPEGLTPNQMVRDLGNGAVNSGYPLNSLLPTLGNNVEAIAFGGGLPTDPNTATALEALNQLLIDSGVNPPGHRIQLLAMDSFNQQMREIGVGHATSNTPDPNFNNEALDEDYWSIQTGFVNTTDHFLTGVVYNDTNSNGSYDLGEGIAGVTITADGLSTTTNSQGGWSLPMPDTGLMTVTASGAGYTGTGTATVNVGTDNIEVDFISNNPTGIVNFGSGTAGGPNHAPVLTSTAKPTLASIPEDSVSPAGTVLNGLVDSAITDVDPGALKGIAIIGTTGTGTWQFSTDGVNFTNVGTVSASSALLLSDADQIRFVPNPLTTGTATFTFRAWDQTTGADGSVVNLSAPAAVGGTTAFSTATDTASITITPVNHAPVLNNSISPTIPAINEGTTAPPSVTIASLVDSSITDVDSKPLKGIAVTGTTGTGTWQFSTNGTTFVSFGTDSDTSALLLPDTDRIRFVPAPLFDGVATFTFNAWDQTFGTKGGIADLTATGTGGNTAFSINQNTVSITIKHVNHAPVLAAGSPLLAPVWVNDPNPAGNTVASIVGSSITDVDTGDKTGIAVIGITFTNKGQWQYSTDSGADFTNFLTGGIVSSSRARLLDAGDLIRFVPSPNFTMTTAASILPTITYRAWDETSGVEAGTANITAAGGTTAFSTAMQKASVRVNDAPVLTPVNPQKTGSKSTVFNITVAQLLGSSVQDFGTGTLQGIAIDGLNTAGPGQWEFSTNNGVSFHTIAGASDATALLLRATDRLRFVPNGTAAVPTLTYRAWDETIGTAGHTVDLTAPNALGQQSAFSSAVDTLTLTLS